MTALTFRRRRLLAAAALALGAGPALADAPAPLPLALTRPPVARPVEVYYGTVKVAPVEVPAPPEPVAPPAPKPPEEPPKPRVETPVYVPIVPTPLWTPPAPAPVTNARADVPAGPQSPINALLHAAFKRVLPPAAATASVGSTSFPQIVILPQPPVERATAAPQPLIVVREAAPEPKAEVAGVRVSVELLAAGGLSAACLLLAAYVVRRSTRTEAAPVVVVPPAPAHDPERDGPLLAGQYKAGPLPDTAERFEMGPTYQEEQAAKKRQEEEQAAAAVGAVMAQNLVMFDAADDEPAPARKRLPLDLPADEDDAYVAAAPIPV